MGAPRYRPPAVTGATAASSTPSHGPERQLTRRAALTGPSVLAIAVYALIAIGAAVAAYYAIFTQFRPV